MEKKPAPSGYCVLCAAKTNLVCHRCCDFYCTKQCQLKDWQRHRYICFSIPALVNPLACSAFDAVELPTEPAAPLINHEAAVKNVISTDVKNAVDAKQTIKPKVLTANGSVKDYDKNNNAKAAMENVTVAVVEPVAQPTGTHNNNNGSNISTLNKIQSQRIALSYVALPVKSCVVYVTGFKSANRLYIRDASETADLAFNEICKKVNLLGQNMPIQQKPFIYALAKHNGVFHRIKKVKGKQMFPRHHYPDLGIWENKLKTEIREISSELLELPCYNLEVQLMSVPNYELNAKIEEFQIKFVGEKFIVTNINKMFLELLHVETQKTLNSQMIQFCSNMNIFGQRDNNTEPQVKADVTQISVAKSQIPIEFKSETDTKSAHLIKAMKCKLNKSPIAATNHEQNTKEIEPTNSETKIQANELFNKMIVETIPDAALATSNKEDNAIETAATTSETNPQAGVPFKMMIPTKPVATLATSNEEDSATNETAATLQVETNGIRKEVPATIASNLVDVKPITANDMVKLNVEPMLVAPFEMRRFRNNANKGLDVFVVDNASVSRGIFGAFDSNYASDYSELHSHLLEIEDSQPYRPVNKEYVIAKLEGVWHRAKVMGIKQKNMYEVMYLEFTTVATVTEQDIRRYPADLVVPCHTSVCLIEGFPHRPTQAQIKFMEEKLKIHSILHIDSITYLQEMALVKCNALIDELNNKM